MRNKEHSAGSRSHSHRLTTCTLALLLCWPPRPSFVRISAAPLLVDVNDRETNTAANTFTGAQVFISDGTASIHFDPTMRTFGTITVTVSTSNATFGYDDRRRGTPANAGAFSEAALLQDFIFSRDDAGNDGIDINITGLTAGAVYPVSIWSFDSGSGGNRVSDWSANGNVVREDYAFDGRVAPVDNTTYRFDFDVAADPTGAILIQGRRDSASVGTNGLPSFGVFLNALRIGDPVTDGDMDGMNDAWESEHGLNPLVNDSAGDPDNDGLTNIQEFTGDTHPNDNDTDNDGLLDGRETRTGTWASTTDTGTSPVLPDTDGDGLGDGVENPDLPFTGPAQPGTDPNIADSDGDLFPDGEEIASGTDPTDDISFPNVAAAATLALDILDDDLSSPVQPGWQGLSELTGWTATFGAIGVTITPVGGDTILDDRDRDTANGGGGHNSMFRDFVFGSGSDAEGEGLQVQFTGLAPNTVYPVTLWSFDKTSAGVRSSRWLASEGAALVEKVPLYTFDGASAAPANLQQNRMQFTMTTDATGGATIQGLAPAGLPVPATVPHNVFLNGLLLGLPPAPAPPLEFTSVALNAAAATPTVIFRSETGQTYALDSSDAFAGWTELNGSIIGAAGDTTTHLQSLPQPLAPRSFFRVRKVVPP